MELLLLSAAAEALEVVEPETTDTLLPEATEEVEPAAPERLGAAVEFACGAKVVVPGEPAGATLALPLSRVETKKIAPKVAEPTTSITITTVTAVPNPRRLFLHDLQGKPKLLQFFRLQTRIIGYEARIQSDKQGSKSLELTPAHTFHYPYPAETSLGPLINIISAQVPPDNLITTAVGLLQPFSDPIV